MPNFIETTLANEAAKKAAAEQETLRATANHAQWERERSSRAAVEASEAEKKRAHLIQAHTVFQETGIKQTLEAIAGHEIELEDVYGDKSELKLTLQFSGGKKGLNIVKTTYLKDGALQIEGDKTQILTATDLKNNDTVAAALEKAVKNPMVRPPGEPYSLRQGPGQ